MSRFYRYTHVSVSPAAKLCVVDPGTILLLILRGGYSQTRERLALTKGQQSHTDLLLLLAKMVKFTEDH